MGNQRIGVAVTQPMFGPEPGNRFHVLRPGPITDQRQPMRDRFPIGLLDQGKMGAGILRVASYLVYAHVISGKLVPKLQSHRPRSAELNMVHRPHRLKPRKLRVFEDFLYALDAETPKTWGMRSIEQR